MASVISTAILRTQTDERLVALSRAGHKRAFEVIAERYRGELSRALRRILPRGSVEDALQQTNLQAWQALSAGTEVRELRAWLHRIARNAAIAAASRGYDYDELKDALLVRPGPEEDLERRDAVRRALRGIAELPERQRDALLTVAIEGRSHAELGLDLGITDTAARQLVRRARVSLIGLMSVAMPPQVVLWAARAGHSVVAGKLAAGKAAAGKAAGTGLGGGLGGSALKVGAIAVTVGGVAAGVPPIRQALVPSRPPTAAHRRQAPRVEPPTLVAASLGASTAHVHRAGTTAAGGRTAAGAAAAGRRHTVHGPRPLLIAATGEAHPVVTSGAAATGAAGPAAAQPTIDRNVPTGQAAANPAAQTAAALLAWWLAHRQSSAASQTTSTAGHATGQEQGSGATSSSSDRSAAVRLRSDGSDRSDGSGVHHVAVVDPASRGFGRVRLWVDGVAGGITGDDEDRAGRGSRQRDGGRRARELHGLRPPGAGRPVERLRHGGVGVAERTRGMTCGRIGERGKWVGRTP